MEATSKEAFASVKPSLTEIQKIVIDWFCRFPLGGSWDEDMIDGINSTRGSAKYKDSTLRTRRKELVDLGLLEKIDTIRNSRGRKMNVYRIAARKLAKPVGGDVEQVAA